MWPRSASIYVIARGGRAAVFSQSCADQIGEIQSAPLHETEAAVNAAGKGKFSPVKTRSPVLEWPNGRNNGRSRYGAKMRKSLTGGVGPLEGGHYPGGS